MKNLPCIVVVLTLLGAACAAYAIEPAALAARLAGGEKLTVIDVRAGEFYAASHIPGAINVPSTVCADKKLPPLGRVVVYDQGLGNTNAAFARDQLNLKPGIQAEILRGGLAAWETTQRETAGRRGAAREQLPSIAYHDLKQATDPDLVLVDLRAPRPAPVARGLAAAPAAASAPLTDLKAEFPRLSVVNSPFDIARRVKAEKSTPPLLVLIDRGDGQAEETARQLRAAGMTRFVILAGGEEILARKGEPGLQRSGSGLMTAPPPVVSSPTAPAQQ